MIAAPRRLERPTSDYVEAVDIERGLVGVAMFGTAQDWLNVCAAGFDPALLINGVAIEDWQIIGPAMEHDDPSLAIATLARWKPPDGATYYDYLPHNRRIRRADVRRWMAAAKSLRVQRATPRPVPAHVLRFFHDFLR